MVSVRVADNKKSLMSHDVTFAHSSPPATLTLWLTSDLQAEDGRRSNESAGGHRGGRQEVREPTERRGHCPRRHRRHARPAGAASGERKTLTHPLTEDLVYRMFQTVNTNAQAHKLNIAHEQELIRPRKKAIKPNLPPPNTLSPFLSTHVSNID